MTNFEKLKQTMTIEYLSDLLYGVEQEDSPWCDSHYDEETDEYICHGTKCKECVIHWLQSEAKDE